MNRRDPLTRTNRQAPLRACRHDDTRAPNATRADRPDSSIRSRGFTLVELLIVVSIMSIAALIVLPSVEATEPYKLDLAANQLADSIRYARGEALRMANPYGVHIEASQKRIRVYRGAGVSLTPTPVYDVYHPLTKRLYKLDLGDRSMPEGLTVSASASWSGVCNQSALLGFDSLGTPRCGDPWSVFLTASKLILTYAGHTRSVVVDGVTGRVTVQ